MENYKVKQRLGKGAQGSVFLVESKQDGKQYVLKKIECNDESDANKAFKEAMALQDLKHPYICGYKEFFVMWDKQESAMFVCIVMEYYRLGDLDKVLKQKRTKQEPLDEMVIKKWLGQIVDALVFVHQKKIIHRDLKPSNIFVTEGLNISIGDFGVATIMDDARTRTRTTVGTMNYIAPEVLERPYDERSDVWSLGCILLELATTTYYDAAQMSTMLFQIKQSPQVLEQLLDKVSMKYEHGKELCQVIRMMLRRNFQQRPTSLELCDLPYIKTSMALNGSQSNTNQEIQEKVKPVPKDKGIAVVLEYMKENTGSMVCQVEALRYLISLTANGDVSLNDATIQNLSENMKKHLVNVDIQIKTCQLFINVLPKVDVKNALYSSQVILPILLAMRSHGESLDLQKVGCQLLMALSANESTAETIGKLGGIQDILAAMRLFPDNAELAISVCGAIWSLAVNEKNGKIVTEERGVQDICGVMQRHSTCVDVIESACSALWSLSMEDENIEIMNDSGTVGLLVDVIRTHLKVAKVVKNACMALASIVEADESCAYQVLNNTSGEIGGAMLLLKVAQIHQNDEDVMENICVLFCELSEYDEVCTELNSVDVTGILMTAKKRFPNNEDLICAAVNALSLLSGSKHAVNRPNSARTRTSIKM